VQRHLRIGYNRAARLIEQMERAGLVSAMQSNGNREVWCRRRRPKSRERRARIFGDCCPLTLPEPAAGRHET
jgi:hypothetical protein